MHMPYPKVGHRRFNSIQFWDACNQLTFFFFTDEPVVLMVFRNTIDNGDVS